jgi:phosphonatase-like hydrolase
VSGKARPVELVVLDMAGTTVRDDGLVERAFVVALDATGIAIDAEERLVTLDFVRKTMGQSKIDVFTQLAGDVQSGVAANAEFEHAYGQLLSKGMVEPIPGAEETMALLRERGISVALTTGFGAATQRLLLESLRWENAADLALTAADAGGRGRPHPDINLMALIRSRASSVKSMVVVGDTSADMKSGVRAGAGRVVGVLSGAHSEKRLLKAGATDIIADVSVLPDLLGLR